MRNSLKSLVAVAAVFAAASAVQAAVITSPGSQTVGGVTVSNITETNNNASSTDFYYGNGTLSNSVNGPVLFFPITGSLPFQVNSTGAGDSDLIDVKLSFDVSSQSPLSVAAFLSEVGDYFASGTGTGGDSASLLIFGANDALLAGNTNNFNAAPGTTNTVWTNTVAVAGSGSATSFHVVIDNILHTATVAPTDFASIAKKGLSITIGSSSGGSPGTPEPASLGLLGLGGLALAARRRKA